MAIRKPHAASCPAERRTSFHLSLGVALTLLLAGRPAWSGQADRPPIGKHERGIAVVLSDRPVETALRLVRDSELLIYVPHPDGRWVERIREAMDRDHLLGTRVYVERHEWDDLGLADHLADWIIVSPDVQHVIDKAKVMRWLRPLGTLWCAGQTTVKPYPAEADDWTHPYHGPDNNPLSSDRLARAPYMTQFLAEPYYVPFPEVTVTSRGRIFKAFGHVGYKRRDWPWLNTLIAINGYNGTLLWKHKLEEGFNIHRNTMVATPDRLYLADSRSCRVLDAATGELLGQITAPEGATGTCWKWMAVEGDVLYALVGEQEHRDPTIRGQRTQAGWPWRPMTPGYDRPDYPWGLGRTLFALDLKGRKALWTYVADHPIDGRAVAMHHGLIFAYAPNHWLAAVDTASGDVAWKNSSQTLLGAIGSPVRAQTARLGFNSTAYMKCDGRAIFFAGPQRERLVAASADDGHLLWKLAHGNYQLILHPKGLYAMGRTGPSRLLDPATGDILKYLRAVRGNCTRATGTIDSIFCRGHDHAGTLRLNVADDDPQRIPLMRPDCHDGVIAAGGMVYWGPWMCDCSLSLVGNIGLAPAGRLTAGARASESDRLKRDAAATNLAEPLRVAPGDWPTYRANSQCTGTSSATLPASLDVAWRWSGNSGVTTTAPVMAAGRIYWGGGDGTVHARDTATGKEIWRAYTGGPMHYPPTIAGNRIFAGSGDGWIYAWQASSGRLLWRFRAAPEDRKIMVYGRLCSTWPVASGIVVDNGVLYAAAGIASYDGTHVYALDAATGQLKWQNNDTGHLAGPGTVAGVSVQGHLLVHQDRLYLAGGNVVSPAMFDIHTGKCLNQLTDQWGGQRPPADPNWDYTQQVRTEEARQKRWGKAPRGCDLYLVGGQVTAFDRLLYSPTTYWAGRYFPTQFLQAGPTEMPVRVAGSKMVRMELSGGETAGKVVWTADGIDRPRALAVTRTSVLVAGAADNDSRSGEQYLLACHRLSDGAPLWKWPLPTAPTWWGLAVDHDGRVGLALQDGSVLCLQGSE